MPALRLCVFCGELSRLAARWRRMRWQPNRLGGGWQAEIRTPNVFSWPRVTAVRLVCGAQRNVAQAQSRADPLRQGFQPRKQVGTRQARLSVPPFFPLASDPSGVCQGLGHGWRDPQVCKRAPPVESEGPLRDFQPHFILFVVCT